MGRDFSLDITTDVALLAVEAEQSSHVTHHRLRYAVLKTRDTAAAYRSQRDVRARSCARPAAVSS